MAWATHMHHAWCCLSPPTSLPERNQADGVRSVKEPGQHQVETAGQGKGWPHAHREGRADWWPLPGLRVGNQGNAIASGSPRTTFKKEPDSSRWAGGSGSPRGKAPQDHGCRAGAVDAEHMSGKWAKTDCWAEDWGLSLSPHPSASHDLGRGRVQLRGPVRR